MEQLQAILSKNEPKNDFAPKKLKLTLKSTGPYHNNTQKQTSFSLSLIGFRRRRL